MLQRRGPTSQGGQIVAGIENLVPRLVAPRVRGDNGVVQHDFYPINVGLDGNRLKRGLPRHAVVDIIEAGQLILVHLHRLADARVKAMWR